MAELTAEVMEQLAETSRQFQQVFKQLEAEQEEYWNSLTKAEQISVFCSVARRIYKGELVDKRSYRGVLYDVFDFGPEAYAVAQDAGYLALHNSIMNESHDYDLLLAFAKKTGVRNPKKAVWEFLA